MGVVVWISARQGGVGRSLELSSRGLVKGGARRGERGGEKVDSDSGGERARHDKVAD